MTSESVTLVCMKPTRKYPDGRTGTYAGYTAHITAQEPTCAPCRGAAAERMREFNNANPELTREQSKLEYQRNRDTYAANNLKSKHGLTLGEYEALLGAQGGGCAICGATKAGGRWNQRFHIDHDHNCCPARRSCDKCRRALLCSPCNVGLGSFGDDPDRLMAAAAYLLTRINVLGVLR